MPAPNDTAERLRRLMGDVLDEQIATAAVTAGHVTQAQLDSARQEQAEVMGEPPRLAAILMRRGFLDDAKVAALETRLAADAFVRPSLETTAEPPPEVRAAAQDPARELGHFVLVALIGQGGTGEVWKAWDRRLHRWVAVKVSTAAPAAGSARERFEREALAAGRLRHPGLVPIHEAGVDRGRVYLVMPLIEGETLETARMSARRALEVVRAAALAIEHAHGQGIVHRDLKPGNVMVDRTGNVYVLDFGLVCLREDEATQLTQPGDVLGTAGYMSPEQARGEAAARGPTTDVYGLGATLYHAVTGAPPFAAPTFAAVVERVLHDDPVPPGRLVPDLDRRIEAVVLRAMDRAPARRYPSAAAFAADLGRILADEEVLAPASGVAQRLMRLIRRRRGAVATIGGVVLIAAVVASARGLLSAERREAVEGLRQMARVSLESALALRRAGDLAGMRRLRPALVAAYQQARGRGAETAEVEYLVGRMYRALLDDDEALSHQERALALDPNSTSSLYERAVLLSARYGRLVDTAETELRLREGDRPAAETAWPELARLRDEIRHDLARLQALGGPPAQTAAAQGILAYHEHRWSEARVQLAAAVAAEPLREEAWQALARAAESERRFTEAEATYTRAIELDRGYLPHAIGRCELRRRLRKLTEASDDATAVLALDAGSVEARLCRGATRTRTAHDEISDGKDPTPTLDGAQEDFDRALAARPSAAAHAARAVVHRYRAIFAERRGGDPFPHLATAEHDDDRAIALDPAGATHWASRARTRTRRGILMHLEGGEPGPTFTAAERDFAEALRLDGNRPEFWAWRAELHFYRARHHVRTGAAPDAEFAAAEEDMATSIRLYSGDGLSYVRRGEMRTWRGQAVADAGGDPLPLWAQAREDLDRAVHDLPRSAEAWVTRARLLTARGLRLGRGGQADLATAAADLTRALAADPRYAEAWSAQGHLRAARGDRKGAAEDLRRAAVLKPRLRHAGVR